MSNFLAIATVTETLRSLLDYYVSKDVTGATATHVSPSGANNTGTGNGLPAVGVNIALYQVMPDAATRNMDLPTRRNADGSTLRRTRAAIDLHYMLSVYGAPATLQDHRVLGSVLRTMHTYATLSRELIDQAATASSGLSSQDLSVDIELVKFIPIALTLDELSRVWSVYFQTSYALSVCYQASVIYIEDETVDIAAALPVRTPNIVTTTMTMPAISAIVPQPATAGDTLTITGNNIGLNAPSVVIGNAGPAPATVVGANQITFTLPPTTLAGVSALSVLQATNFGPPTPQPGTRGGVQSDIVAMALAPTLTLPSNTVNRGGPFTVNFDTPIGPRQDVALLLGSYAIPLAGRVASSGAAPATSFTFMIPEDAPTGLVPIRLQVDGVQSALTFDTTQNHYVPTVTVS
jgi:hypothetical protein